MEIYCNNKDLLNKAVDYSKKLGIDGYNAIISIKRLPPSFSQVGIIEHPLILGKRTYLSIYVRLNKERYVTLAHEMVHARQFLKGQTMCENEAYLLEKTLYNNP